MAKVIGSDALGALKTWILNKLSGKSDTGHTHDDRYYTETEVDTKLSGKGTYSKPSTGIPKTDLASAVQTSLGKADSALQSLPSHTHDDRYYTETEANTLLNAKVNLQQGSTLQAITGSSNNTTAIAVKAGVSPTSSPLQAAYIEFQNSSGTTLGKIGVNSASEPSYISNTGTVTTMSLRGHNHDDRYYTSTTTQTLLNQKANSSHTHAWSTITDKTSVSVTFTSNGTSYSYDLVTK